MRYVLTLGIVGCLLLPVGSWANAAPGDNRSAHASFQLGESKVAARDAVGALPSFRRAVALDPTNLIYVLTLAQTDAAVGRFDDARRVLVHSAASFTDPGDRVQVKASLADTECAWGQALAAKRSYRAAIPHFEAAVAFDGSHRGASGAFDYEQLASAHMAVDSLADADSDLQNARRLRGLAGDRAGETSDLNRLGLLRDGDGRALSAVAAYDQALLTAPGPASQGSVINNRGLAYQNADQYELAIADFKHARDIAHASGDIHREAAALNNIGSNLHALGQYALAIDSYSKAIVLFRSDHNRRGEAIALSNIGYAKFYLRRYSDAASLLRESIDLYQALGDGLDEEIAIGNLGCIESALGDNAAATRSETDALARATSLGDITGEGLCLLELGRIELAASKPVGAISYLNRALIVLRDTDAAAPQAKVCDALMAAWRARGRAGLATFWGKQAVNTYQSIRGNIRGLGADLQAGYARTHSDAYRNLADLLVTQGRLPEAQKVLDLLKLDEIDEYDRGGRMLIRGPRPLVRAGRILVRGPRPVRAGRILVRSNNPPVRGGQALAAALQSLAGIDIIELGPIESRFADMIITEPPRTLARTLARLPSGFAEQSRPPHAFTGLGNRPPVGTAYIATLEGANRLSVIVATHSGTLSVSTRIAALALNQEVLQLRGELADPSSHPEADAHRLYTLLLPAKITDVLDRAHVTNLIWSLDGTLRYIPMAALYDGHRYLVERYASETFTPEAPGQPTFPQAGPFLRQREDKGASASSNAGAPKSSIWGGKRVAGRCSSDNVGPRLAGRWAALGLGVTQAHIVTDPVTGTQTQFDALPSVADELHHLIRESSTDMGMMPGRILIDGGFSAAAMRKALAGAPTVVHIASHFQLLPGDDAQSYLLLGDGSTMTVAQIDGQRRLFRGIGMLTLSACSTAVGGDGKEIDGLAGVARAQGAASVLATLWPVEDPSTLALMTSFYKGRASGIGSAQALRDAQISLLHPRQGPPSRYAGPFLPQREDKGVATSTHAPAPYPPSGWAPYAHPYYWAPFILMGDGR